MVDDVVFNGRAKLALVSTCLIMKLFVLLAAAAAVCAVVSALDVIPGKSHVYLSYDVTHDVSHDVSHGQIALHIFLNFCWPCIQLFCFCCFWSSLSSRHYARRASVFQSNSIAQQCSALSYAPTAWSRTATAALPADAVSLTHISTQMIFSGSRYNGDFTSST